LRAVVKTVGGEEVLEKHKSEDVRKRTSKESSPDNPKGPRGYETVRT